MDKPRVLISLCLLGAQCRYDGQCKPPLAELALLQARFDLIPICPEQLGGQIYDGSFSRHLVPGWGVATQLLRESGLLVCDETQIGWLLAQFPDA